MIKEYYVEYEEFLEVRRINSVFVVANSEEEAIDKVSQYDFYTEPEILDEFPEDKHFIQVTHIHEDDSTNS